MATVDSLEITLETRFEKASTALNGVVKQLGLVAEGISSIGNNRGLNEFARKAQEAVKEFSTMKDVGKDISSSIQPQMQKVSKTLEQFEKQYENLGKGISFQGTTEQLKKEIEKTFNSLEKAKVDLQKVSLADNIDISKLESSVIKVAELKNKLESFQSILENRKMDYQEGLRLAEEQANKTAEAARNAAKETEDLNTVSDKVGQNGFKNASILLEEYKERLSTVISQKENLEKLGVTSGGAYEDAIKSIEKFKNKIGELEQTKQTLKGFSGELQRMGNLISKTFSDLNPMKGGEMYRYLFDSIKTYIKNAQIAAGTKVYTDDFKRLVTDIERAKSSLEKLQRKKRDLEAGGVSEEDKQWQRVTAAIATAENQLNSYKAQKREMEMSGADVQPSGGLADQSFIKNAGIVAGEALRSLRQGISEIGGSVSQAVGNIPIIGRVAKEAAFLGQKAFQGLKFAMTGIISAGQKVTGALSAITSGMVRLASGVKNAISKFSSLAKSFIGIKSSSKKMNNSFSRGLKFLLRYGLGVRSLYALINKLRTAMKEAFGNLAQYSSETNASLSMLKSSLFALKNSLAVAFDPIVNVIAPYLSMFIDLVTRAFNVVGQFFSALTGKATAVQTKKNFMDYAAGLEKTGGAAKKAEKDIKHGLRAFDELNNLTSNEPASGSGGAGGGATEILPADMFTTVTVESDISDFAEKVKQAWENADFTEVGGIVGEKLKNALDTVDMTPIQERAEKIGASLGTFITGFVQTEGLGNSIGEKIGSAINIGISGASAFFDNTNFEAIGNFIGEGLTAIVTTVNWEEAGNLLSSKWNAFFDIIGGVAQTFDFSELGLQLSNGVNGFIEDFDWAGNAESISSFVKGLLDTIISFLENTDWQELGNGVADFIGTIDWSGISDKIFEGIGAALGGLAAFLWGVIEDGWKNVITWWEETAFEDGQFTITGLLNGIWEGIKNISTWIYDHIFKPFIDGFKAAFQIHSPSKVMEEQGNFIMQGLLDGINALVQRVIDVFNNIKQKIVDVWNGIKTKTTEIWTSIKGKISDTWSGIKTSVSDFTDSIKNVVKNAWEKVKSTTEDIWDGIKNAIKSPINGILGFINGLIEGVEGGLNRMIRAVNGLHFDLPDWLPIVGGKTLGFTIPEISVPKIPLLAKGGIAMDFTPAIIGEAGREAVLPLTNPRSMGMIADSILDNASYATYANGSGEDFLKKIEEATYRGTMRAIEAAGGIKAEASFKVEGDRAGIFKVTREEARDFYKRTRRPAFDF